MTGKRFAARRWPASTVPAWLAAAVLTFSALNGFAQAPPPSTAPAETTISFPCWIRITADQVNLRSRADRNSLAVARLDRDQVLQAVGSEYGWFRVLPPEGVFSFVSARYVDQISETEGIVSVSSGDLRVRVGSQITEVDPLQCEVQRLLARGAKVRIIGHRDEWLKIVPPEGVFFYVSAEHVTQVSAEEAAALAAATSRASSSEQLARPVEAPDLSGPWGQRLVLVEARIEAEARKDALQQSWTEPIAELRPIAEQRSEPAVARLGQRWIGRLEERIADQAALRAVRQVTGDGSRTQAQLDREMQQLQRTRERATSQPGFTARGQLRESFALRGGAGPFYRLLDPISGTVVAYLEFPITGGIEPREYMGLYVGVVGEKRSDPALGADVIQVSRLEALVTRPARTNP